MRVLSTAGARVSTAVERTRWDERAARRGTGGATTRTRGGTVTRARARDGFVATKEESEGRMSERELVDWRAAKALPEAVLAPRGRALPLASP